MLQRRRRRKRRVSVNRLRSSGWSCLDGTQARCSSQWPATMRGDPVYCRLQHQGMSQGPSLTGESRLNSTRTWQLGWREQRKLREERGRSTRGKLARKGREEIWRKRRSRKRERRKSNSRRKWSREEIWRKRRSRKRERRKS